MPFRGEVRPEGTEGKVIASGKRPWLPPLIWAAVILAASSLQELQTTTGHVAIRDKLAHFGEYFVFGWLVARSFDGRGWRGGKHFAWTMLLGIYLGALDEFYQGFVPGRERDVLDLLADVIGAAAGWYFSREDTVGRSCGSPRNA
ncbi:MAG: VanZ family protein [Candidatus Eiseniibacteriota bacterium]